MAWGLAAAAVGAATAAASGLSAAALRPAFDEFLVGRPGFGFRLKKDVMLLKPCSLAASSVFGSFFGGVISGVIANLKSVSNRRYSIKKKILRARKFESFVELHILI